MAKKRKGLLFLAAVALAAMLIAPGIASALEWADGNFMLNGFIKNWTGYRFGFYGHERDSGLSIFRTVIQLEADAKFSDTFGAYAIFRFAREPEYNLEDEARDLGNFDGDELDENKFREYYLTWQATDRVWAAFGKQQVVWGDLGGQGQRVMDVLNPLDLRWHFALEGWEDMRKPLHMLNVIYSMPAQNANIQIVWIPGLEDTWERVNSIYTNPGHRYGLNQAVGFPPKTVFPGVEDDKADATGIEKKISDSAIAIRWQQTIGGVTYALMDAYTHTFAPGVWIDGTGALRIEYLRQNVLGFSFNWYDELTKGVIRGEIGHFHHLPYTAEDFGLAKLDTIKWGLGWDSNFFFDWLSPTRSLLVNIQCIGQYILDHEKGLQNLGYTDNAGIVDEWDVLFTLFLNWGTFGDRLQFNLYPAYNWSRDFGIIQAWIDWKPAMFSQNFTITPKVNLLYGRTPYSGDFGLTRGCSEAILELKYEF